MDVLRVVKVTREPRPVFSSLGRKELFLIIYDTVWVHRIHERLDSELSKANPDGVIEVKAKFALAFCEPDDANSICQYFATRRGAKEAEWVHGWHDILGAIERLRARHPNEQFPDEIDYVLDWPNYYYWQRLKEGQSPERQKYIDSFLAEAGQS